MRNKKALKQIISYNEESFNYMKLLEELAELNEVVIKTITKHEEYKPPTQHLIEELGDVTLRINLLSLALGIQSDVKQRVKNKITKLLSYIDEGKYKGGV